MNGWRPIATAPTGEDERIDLWADRYYHHCRKGASGWFTFDKMRPNRDVRHGPVTSWATQWSGLPVKPTHWRPMPAGPEEIGADEILITIRVGDGENVATHIESGKKASRDPRPLLRKAILSLEAEAEGFGKCPMHRGAA